MDLLELLQGLFGAIGIDQDSLKHPTAQRVDAVPGDHIAVRIGGTEAWHHAIYIGPIDGLGMVVEMAGKTAKDTSPIALSPLQDLGPYLVVKYADEYNTEAALSASKERAILVAKAAQETPSKFTYNIVTSNCETLALFCRTGKWVDKKLRDTLADTLIVDTLADTLAAVTMAPCADPKQWMRKPMWQIPNAAGGCHQPR